MSIEMITLLFFGSLLFFLVLGLPLAFVLGGVSVIFLYFTWGPDAFYMVASQIWSTMGNFTLVAIPLFVFMAMVLERTGVAKDLYRMMYLWWGGLRGGLAIGTLGICAIFAAMCGISGAAVVAMGTIALPSMLERGYDKRMVLGCINTGGGWGILIPPSILMILYSLITGVSVGQMFAAGVLPGILLMVLTCIYIIVRCYFQPHLAPALPKDERASWREKMLALRAVILPIIIVVVTLGSIIAGVTTPTEAAAVGVFGALVSALVYRKFSWELMRDASIRTFKLTGMIMWILFAAHAFSAAYQSMGAQELIEGMITGIPGGPWAVIITMMVIVFFLAMVLDPVGIMLITLPVFLPIVQSMGFDPVWFGILFVINMEIGYMTPPFGFNLFYLKGVVPPSITMKDIYVSVIPFVLVEIVGLALIMIFPEIATYLPDLMF
ncbi:MAG: TRAP transporter large permease subunit [Alloalcanivorax venustensis]|jgi:tripartite ATP-independent transporter DctM subunit|uniref:TRAP transporter large permease protein n=1 Tax=Alloalcanivorax venustensis ISO4 TaxID=1177184 RepID=A0ABS0AFV5_9GAMM|nr:TRAP transporter large permease subunit [Alloalcanivorax venustensis]KXJ42526.1 MAG: TRAP dicarboxylate transporter subunit DctM [Alcanivorax sp. Nap_24]MAQ35455.1 TRAP transporter permease DctM/Q [Alcanivorax sp.]MCH9782371.1 TRAP transporter large permease subunit [Gammaproteobacteria bacterium]MEA3261846.1 TRAP transporter large permease subunit [Pseudomonadota bacterium]SMO74171.1 TRAP transporter, DctM subunit [Alcanivorax sp. DSM 26295]|tara:strand:- start:28370 stop:29680 length:1311 start_codon:yes stop_codon:yes gene_type:complete